MRRILTGVVALAAVPAVTLAAGKVAEVCCNCCCPGCSLF